MNAQKTLDELTAASFKWEDASPHAIDAIRGSLLELKRRDTLGEYLADNPVAPLVERAIQRLSRIQELPWPSIRPRLIDASVGLGTFGWKYSPAIIKRALDRGIRLIDTAEGYGYGRVEDALGPLVADSDVIIATKVARNHLSPTSVLNAALRSARRLGGRIGLYQVHWPNPKVPLRRTMEAMRRLLDTGIIERAGVCNVSTDLLCAYQAALLPHPISAVQVRYNLLDRGIEAALLPFCKAHAISVIAYSPLGQDFRRILEADKNRVLEHLGNRYSATPAQVALAWIVAKGAIPIPRTNNAQHVDEIADVQTIVLNGTQMGLLDEAFSVRL